MLEALKTKFQFPLENLTYLVQDEIPQEWVDKLTRSCSVGVQSDSLCHIEENVYVSNVHEGPYAVWGRR